MCGDVHVVVTCYRWIELTRKIELCVEIHELSELGEYVPVEVVQRPEVLTGGVYQLRQVRGALKGVVSKGRCQNINVRYSMK